MSSWIYLIIVLGVLYLLSQIIKYGVKKSIEKDANKKIKDQSKAWEMFRKDRKK